MEGTWRHMLSHIYKQLPEKKYRFCHHLHSVSDDFSVRNTFLSPSAAASKIQSFQNAGFFAQYRSPTHVKLEKPYYI